RPTRGTSARAARAEATWPVPPVTRIGASDMEQWRTVAQPSQDLVLVRQNNVLRRNRPGDSDVGVVPDHAAFGSLIVGRGHLIDDLGFRCERAIRMQKADRHPDLSPVLGADLGADPLTEAWRPLTDIDRDVEDRPLDAAHEFALRIGTDLAV